MKRSFNITYSAVIAICVLSALMLLLSYQFVKSDVSLLSDESCLHIVFNDVLGKSKYPETCDKSSYLSTVKNTSESKNVCLFQLQPIPEKEKNCQAIAIVIDRKTGEAWPLNK
jgi:Na+-translocating ferredoxin:NAD+ oxidoreductase RnfG subunit